MIVDINEQNMKLIQEALSTQCRLLASYIHPDEQMRIRLMYFQRLKAEFDELIMRF